MFLNICWFRNILYIFNLVFLVSMFCFVLFLYVCCLDQTEGFSLQQEVASGWFVGVNYNQKN